MNRIDPNVWKSALLWGGVKKDSYMPNERYLLQARKAEMNDEWNGTKCLRICSSMGLSWETKALFFVELVDIFRRKENCGANRMLTIKSFRLRRELHGSDSCCSDVRYAVWVFQKLLRKGKDVKSVCMLGIYGSFSHNFGKNLEFCFPKIDLNNVSKSGMYICHKQVLWGKRLLAKKNDAKVLPVLYLQWRNSVMFEEMIYVCFVTVTSG